ncbi:uncharacterized protein BXZ73DRAFT_47143 [Epithele typhae]|uniref:uncharacterized protein n=1 Tax=Epithele typhae TaxID=378194 RepID=UPI0020076723|nr:uncharacterized protein BXZ73DRAFT_47143 [Epithele typhae]KAH9931649.1 hypothetical protein BXZ73DRAFT_47143 [Epithele typhae]
MRSGDSDRNSLSSSGSRPSSQNSQYLIAEPPSATLHGSPAPSPFTVRPFSPTEKWSFPKPPTSQNSTPGAGTGVGPRGALPESENPFADFGGADADESSVVTHSTGTTALHFAAVETIQRAFAPSMTDELAVRVGDEVRIVKRFDDGWAIAEHIAHGAQGLIPIDCLRAPEEELPAFLAKKRISSYHAGVRASTINGSMVGAAL